VHKADELQAELHLHTQGTLPNEVLMSLVPHVQSDEDVYPGIALQLEV
jgi:hypothetical protein